MTFPALFLLAVLLPARSAGASEVALRAAEPRQAVSLDPLDPAWGKVPSAEIPLMPQALVNPRGGGTVASVRVQAAASGKTMYLRLQWPDPSADDSNSAAESFSDACAVELPARPGSWPSPFMGDAANPVVLWRWSAAAQKDAEAGWQGAAAMRPRMHMDDGKEFGEGNPLFRAAEGAGNPLARKDRKSPVEVLSARGFGTLTMSGEEPVRGKGAWKDGAWSVVFSRAFEGEPAFRAGQRLPVAFAVWDGGKGERNGAKSLSVWQSLEIGRAPAESFASDAAQGKRVFRRYGCAVCHGEGGKGGVKNPNSQGGLVPPINRVAEGFSVEEVKRVIQKGRQTVPEDPRGPVPPLHMNNWESVMDDAELDALVKYLFSLMPKETKGQEW